MGKLVLIVIAAVWAAVLIPPLLRSRVENRPNSSVTDFRRNLSRLQRTVPTRTSMQMRGMARPLAQSPLSRPAAAGRPGQAVRRSHAAAHHGHQSLSYPTAGGHLGGSLRMHEGSLQRRADYTGGIARPHHREPHHREPHHRREQVRVVRREVDPRAAVRRRRSNVVFGLLLLTACSLFLAATTKATVMLYVFTLAFLGLCGYVYLLVQIRDRERGGWTREWPYAA
jgi:hypothetical protein